MATTLELIYARGSMFGRDLLHYIVSGVVFAVACLGAVWIEWNCAAFIDRYLARSAKLDTVEKLGLGILLLLFLYASGHVLLIFGFQYKRMWRKLWARSTHVRSLNRVSESLKDLQPGASDAASGRSLYWGVDVHLVCELSVFRAEPELHWAFVERYNSLAMLRLGLASAMLTGALVSGLVWIVGTTANWNTLLLAVAWLAVGSILMRQHCVTYTGFLRRVAAAYLATRQGL